MDAPTALRLKHKRSKMKQLACLQCWQALTRLSALLPLFAKLTNHLRCPCPSASQHMPRVAPHAL